MNRHPSFVMAAIILIMLGWIIRDAVLPNSAVAVQNDPEPKPQPVYIVRHIDKDDGTQTLNVRNDFLPGTFRVGKTFSLPDGVKTPKDWNSRVAIVMETVSDWAIIKAADGPATHYWFRPASHEGVYEAK